ncbi:hypothetical protein AB0P53_002565 [Listeria monocytogenes]
MSYERGEGVNNEPEDISYPNNKEQKEYYFMKCHICGEKILGRETITYEYAGQVEAVHESCYFKASSEI